MPYYEEKSTFFISNLYYQTHLFDIMNTARNFTPYRLVGSLELQP